ncbi:MAG: hypothetical protein H0U97_01875 [Gammaproteobacteria bacterium]|nr:hypothetical protein [Gammaproteobacteria bacterium]
MLIAYLSQAVSRRLGLLGAVGYAVLIVAASRCPSVAADDQGSNPHEDANPALASAPTTGEHLTELDHPLWKGRMEKDERAQRVRAFDEDWNRIDFRRGEGGPVFRRYLDDLGVKEIVQYFEGKNAFCHGELHGLGSLLLERTGNLAVSLAMCGDACTYSCTHGVLREYFAGHKVPQSGTHAHAGSAGTEYEDVDMNRVRDEIIDLCRQDSTIIKGFLRGNCGHAMGHAFGVISGGSMRKAQQQCGIFGEAAMEYYCETGVFMEYEHEMVRDFNENLKTKIAGWLTGAKGRMAAAIRYCESKTQFVSACIRYLVKSFHDYAEVERVSVECLELSGVSRRSCFFGLAFASVTYVASKPSEVNRVCAFGDEVDKEMCVSGLGLLKDRHDRKEAIVSACEHLASGRLKVACLEQTERSYYQTDNPIFEKMLVGQVRPTAIGRGRNEEVEAWVGHRVVGRTHR